MMEAPATSLREYEAGRDVAQGMPLPISLTAATSDSEYIQRVDDGSSGAWPDLRADIFPAHCKPAGGGVTTAPKHPPIRGTTTATRVAAALGGQSYARRGTRASEEVIRVVIADDHTMFREGLKALLRAALDIDVAGEAADGDDAISVATRLRPRVLVLDLDMPRRDGATTLAELQRVLPDVYVLILTMHSEDGRLISLLESGARGYLTKTAASRDLVEAIRVVAAGEIYVRPVAARTLAGAVVPQRAAETARGRFKLLSSREQTILRLVAEGYNGAEVSRHLHISSKTVDAYKHRIEDKLGLSHRTEYVRFAFEAGILGFPAPK